MSENIEYSVELKEDQYEWLREMTEEHGLIDESKAVRCLIDFAREKSDLESDIFEEIRCMNC
ncbi:MAG TPA: hypothetical protein VLU25_14320 [Acidobacteriota bacterium]|nr:hypothetical protein [Acidobacteriota bacterium]